MKLFMKVWIKRYSQWDYCWYAKQIAKKKQQQKTTDEHSN